MPVSVQQSGRRHSAISPARIRVLAQRMLRALALDDAELSIMLCDDVVMRALNRRYRGYDRTTDVLAFALGEGRRMPVPGPLARRHRDLLADRGAQRADRA